MSAHASTALADLPPPAMAMLDPRQLHPCLDEPVMGAIDFLNEVIDRYPDAISFAPGAPAPTLLEPLDLSAHLQTYLAHLAQTEGLGELQVRRRLFQYGPSRGIINALLAQALRQDQSLDIAPSSIVVTVGFQEAMFLVLRALFATPGDVLAVVQPCFVGAMGAARALDIPLQGIDEHDGRVDMEQLHRACTALRAQGRRVRALYVAPDVSNPSGSLLDRQQRQALLDAADAHDFWLLEDSTYGFTVPQAQRLPSLKAMDRTGRVIHMGTFAKIALPGIRVGFVIADQCVDGRSPRLLADALATLKSMLTVNTSPVCQAIAAGMLLSSGGSLAALGAERAAFYQGKLARLLAGLQHELGDLAAAHPGLRWNRPMGGFFVCLQLGVQVDADLLELSARDHGVLWTPMRMFYLDGGGQHSLRLSCSYLTDAQIDDGVKRLRRFLCDPRVLG
ncbi:PLP-dependent aminotransferase family protein [Xanthomonas oryzae]|uniref:Aminotransferase n=1 Tax=Xanthomonas oryzae TaxID=347 RepID=K9MGM0_9XANT|nr:PLP-dependent aminotransferase family protein [Xanthomonas oryzae]AFV26070.1 aminotransferase [Xanthomonas oryzae]UWI58549.1 PLP-dependent aminotransferase family protein [Xanthomonas oryzae pv. oryzae]